MSVVINDFSSGEANIFTPICCGHAKINPSHTPQATNLLCSASDSPNKLFKALIEVVDCFNNICIAEFDMIGFPYSLDMKSSISCDIVVIHN